MDANSFNVNVLKEKPRIVNLLERKGPMVAPAIAKELNLNSFLASALLSELLHDRLLKSSNMKVGGGPLYYVPGQEAGVENFVQYLAGKEREAFHLLKKEEILEDSKQDPAIRVALRAIKDFAVPLKVYMNEKEVLFWKLHTIANEEFERRINILFNPKTIEEKKEEISKPQEKKEEIIPEKIEEKAAQKEEKKTKTKKKVKISFESMVDGWINENNASIITLSKDSKNAQGRISISGKEHIIISRNKRILDEIDLIIASQMGLNEQLPVILLTAGKPSKKAEEVMPLFKNLKIHRL